MGKMRIFQFFCFLVLWKMQILGFIMFIWLQHVNVSYERKYLLGHIQYNIILKMRIFRKTNVSTRLHKNGHNLTCDHYFS